MIYKKVKNLLTGTDESALIKQIKDDGTELFIPFAEWNADYAKYLAWLAEGNIPEPSES